ncbi:hypothetical protein [Paracoccus jeotgali]|uniref:Uncharacterized protein n=1 Tax=Paracoccus jeotgali TaxID=2065379 RepID=A0A2K9MK58_9RHOB|nr:hypothetical protein [Paracoccus jeotgali]AUM75872.1 hypothetical protein CYR75_15750 [Paracoccus jeotgali]
MADATPTTPLCVTKTLPFAQTPLTFLFSHLLAALTTHLVAERGCPADLEVGEQQAWEQEAILARARLVGHLAEIARTAPASAHEILLQRMAAVLEGLISSEEPGCDAEDALRFSVPPSGAGMAGVMTLLRRAARGIDLMAELPRYRQRVARLRAVASADGAAASGSLPAKAA